MMVLIIIVIDVLLALAHEVSLGEHAGLFDHVRYNLCYSEKSRVAAVDQLAQVVLEILLDQEPVSVQHAAELVVVGDVVFGGGAVHAQVVHVSVVQLDGSLV